MAPVDSLPRATMRDGHASDRAVLDALHQTLLLGDLSAREPFAEAMLPWLRRKLRAAFRRADDTLVQDAAADAVPAYLARPGQFDATRGVALGRYLFVIAWRRLANKVRDAGARAALEISYEAAVAVGVSFIAPPDANSRDRAIPRQGLLAAASNLQERRALCLWINGAGAPALAEALGVSALSSSEQQREVKRFKDRLRYRLRAQIAFPEHPPYDRTRGKGREK